MSEIHPESAPSPLQHHPAAAMFPVMDPSELATLASSIRLHGFTSAITLCDGMVLDGRSRLAAAQLAGVEPKFQEFTGGDPLEFILRKNLYRRHLTASQRALAAAKVATLPKGRPRTTPSCNAISPSAESPSAVPDHRPESTPSCNGISAPSTFPPSPSQDGFDSQRARNVFHGSWDLGLSCKEAAKRMRVGTRLIERARFVLKHPKLAAQVEAGTMKLSEAEREIKAAKAAAEPPRDRSGTLIPRFAVPLWKRRKRINDVVRNLFRALIVLQEASRHADPLFSPVDFSTTIPAIELALHNVRLCYLHHLCKSCHGNAPYHCRSCKGRGFISKHQVDPASAL